MPFSNAHSDHVLAHRPIEGFWRHRVWDRSGALVDPGTWKKNLIVFKTSELLAWFFRYGGGVSGPYGIQYYALGSGLTSWDSSLPSPTTADTTLETEIVDGSGVAVSRKVPTIEYLDSAGAVTATLPATTVKLTVVYDYTEMNDPGPPVQNKWREFAVFGANAVAGTADSGYMINHVTHGVFTKTNLLKVERTVRFSF